MHLYKKITKLIRDSGLHTCKRLCAGVNPRQAFRGSKVGDLQHSAVGVDQHIVPLEEKQTS